MTTPARLEHDLPSILGELATGPYPDYIHDALAVTQRTRQRSAWTSPERWFPMADIASRPAFAPRLPWRPTVVALIVLALSVALAFAVIGTRQAKLPPPFGVAGNGLIAYSNGGDIYTLDPVTGAAKAVVTGPETDLDPSFSPDGTRLMFLRRDDADCCMTFRYAIAAADGSNVRVLPQKLTSTDQALYTPDGHGLIVATAKGPITRYDIAGGATPVVLGSGRFLDGEIRPPDAAQILFDSDSTPQIDLWIVNADGTGARVVVPATALQGKDVDLAEVRWSPDGTMIAFTCAPSDGSEGWRICLTDAAGSPIHTLTTEPGTWTETDLRWSPDGRSIAFNRWQLVGTDWLIRPIGVVSVDGGPVTGVGDTPESAGALFDWSPDGKSLLSLPARFDGSPLGQAPAKPIAIDVATGTSRQLPWDITSNVSWQRVAR